MAADVTKNAGLLERRTNEIVQIFHMLRKIFQTILSAQFCFTHTTTMFIRFLTLSDKLNNTMYSSSNQERWKHLEAGGKE